MTITDGSIFLATVGVAFWMLKPRLRNSPTWLPTVTPLASIIGSGFLVAAPLLAVIVGNAAPIAMLGIVILAFFIGGVIRFNIIYLEPALEERSRTPKAVFVFEKLSNFTLSIAYIVSVAFYLRLLASFVTHNLDGGQSDFYANLITTAILAFIGVIGFFRGLRSLEKLESISVTLKLAIIAGLLVGLIMFDVETLGDTIEHGIPSLDVSWFEKLRMLAGILLVVQGFETSRYLGAAYDSKVRVKTMRRAQIISAVIYVVFVFLALPLLPHLVDTHPNETAIIELARFVSPWLPFLLIIAAVMSQFSAAVADTVGGGGLLEEETNKKIKSRPGYLLIAVAGIALVWFADIFQIISIASRAFSFYYLLQCVNAWLIAGLNFQGKRLFWERLRFGVLILLLAFATLYGRSAG